MLNVLLLLCLSFGVMATAPAHAKDEILSGDTRLACEAILCLSTGGRPEECDPAISKFFSIIRKNFGQTLQARRDFLNLCPSASAPNMPSLVNNIVNAAGQCDADTLNRTLAYQVQIKVCDDDSYWLDEEERCYYKTITVIGNSLPSHCQAYASHEYTWKVSARYEGEVMNGGRWVNEY